MRPSACSISTGSRSVDATQSFASCGVTRSKKACDLAGGGEAEAVEGEAAGPVEGRPLVDVARAVCGGDHPLGQVIGLLEAAAVADGQIARAPEIFHRGLGRVPFPPAAALGRIAAKLARQHRAVVRDMVQHLAEAGVELRAAPAFPAAQQVIAVAGEFQAPVRIVFHRQDGGVVGPVFEERPVAVGQPAQVRRAVALLARPQDQVMGAGERVDAVELHETQVLYDVEKRVPARVAGGRGGQQVTVEKDPARGRVVEPPGHLRTAATGRRSIRARSGCRRRRCWNWSVRPGRTGAGPRHGCASRCSARRSASRSCGRGGACRGR